ncbi:MAG: hypothetical protein P8O73_09110, partial [SAR324 cluster bacterium]|nr:hypothetical protein [SAR324 cluster bacterium]
YARSNNVFLNHGLHQKMRDTGNLRITPEAQFPNFGITGIACLDRPDLKLRTRGYGPALSH